MKKSIIFGIFIISVLLLLGSTLKINVLQNKYSQLEIENILYIDSMAKVMEVLKNTSIIYSVNINDCTVKNINTKEFVRLFSLLDKPSNVIIRLIDSDCSSCNQNQMEILNDLSIYGNLIILSTASNMRYLRLREKEVNQTIYCMDATNKLFPEDDNTKILVIGVNADGTIIKSYYVDDSTFFLVKSIMPFTLKNRS